MSVYKVTVDRTEYFFVPTTPISSLSKTLDRIFQTDFSSIEIEETEGNVSF